MTQRIVTALALLLGASASWGQDAGAELQRMAEALSRADYAGTVVFWRDGQLDALRVRRAHGPSGPSQQVERLTGPVQPYRQDAQGAQLGTGPLYVTESGAVATGDWAAPLQAAYELRLVGADRVAGRDARVVDAQARDAFRYSRRFWIDVESGLLLRAMAIGADGIPVEQWMFTDLVLQPAPAAQDDSGMVSAEQPRNRFPVPRSADVANTRFVVADAPRDFTLLLAAQQQGSEHLVYSDGLAKVSVYVETLPAQASILSGAQQRGALSVFGRVFDGLQVTVVGEVPPATAERFAQGLARRDGG